MLSIITPVLNGEKFIEKNIISIQELSIPFEHIIVDAGSTDGTIDILKKFKHISVVNQKRLTGMYGAIDLGLLSIPMENIFVGLIVMIQLLKMVLKKCMKQLVLINLTWFTQIHTGIFFQKIKKN